MTKWLRAIFLWLKGLPLRDGFAGFVAEYWDDALDIVYALRQRQIELTGRADGILSEIEDEAWELVREHTGEASGTRIKTLILLVYDAIVAREAKK